MKVSFHDICVDLGGRRILDHVSLEVPSGSVVGLLGPNGSGKSTLLRTLYRAVRPNEGSARLEGRDVRDFAGREAARAIGVMLQDSPSEFDLTVAETVMLGRAPHQRSFGGDSAEDRRIVAEAIAATGIAGLEDRMLASLSGGQRQRVMLARALAQSTPVLVLDEPSNHLDISHQHELMSIVNELNRTVITALHDLNLAMQYCDQVAVLAHGRIVAHGAPARILTPELIRDTFHVDARHVGTADEPVLAFRRLSAPTHPTSLTLKRS